MVDREGIQLYKRGDTVLTDAIFVGKYYPVGDLGKARLLGVRGDILDYRGLKNVSGLYVPDETMFKYGTVAIFQRLNLFHLGLHLKLHEERKNDLNISVKMSIPGDILIGQIDEDGALDEFAIEDLNEEQRIIYFVTNNPLKLEEDLENLRFRFSAIFRNPLEKEELSA